MLTYMVIKRWQIKEKGDSVYLNNKHTPCEVVVTINFPYISYH